MAESASKPRGRWRRQCWGALTLGFLALAVWLGWRHVRPMALGVASDEPLIPISRGFVNLRGVVLPMPQIGEIHTAFHDFDDHGWARVCSATWFGGVWCKSNYRWIDRSGRVVLPTVGYTAHDFDAGGLALVDDRGEFRWIDRTGRNPFGRTFPYADPFDLHGWARVKFGDDAWGWIDRRGNEPLPRRWNENRSFGPDGAAPVHDGGPWRRIDRTGQALPEVIPEPPWISAPQGDEDGSVEFSGVGLGKGIKDRQGRVIIAARWPYLERTRHGYVGRMSHHPWLEEPWFERFATWTGLIDRLAWRDGLEIAYDRRGRVIWRSDEELTEPLLLPAAALAAIVALLCGWGYRAAIDGQVQHQ